MSVPTPANDTPPFNLDQPFVAEMRLAPDPVGTSVWGLQDGQQHLLATGTQRHGLEWVRALLSGGQRPADPGTRVVVTLPPDHVGVARVGVFDGETARDPAADESARAALLIAYVTLARLLPPTLRRDLEPLASRLDQPDDDGARESARCPDCHSLLEHEWHPAEPREYGSKIVYEPEWTRAFCPVCDWAEDD